MVILLWILAGVYGVTGVVLAGIGVVGAARLLARAVRARRLAASRPVAQSGRCAPATESLPLVGAVDLEELWMEIRFAATLHRIGADVTEGAIREPGRSEWV